MKNQSENPPPSCSESRWNRIAERGRQILRITSCLLSAAFPISLRSSGLRFFLFILLCSNCLLPAISFAQRMAGGGYHSLALCTDGNVWSWGWNDAGQIGQNSTAITQYTTPVQVKGPGGAGNLTGIIALSTGWKHNLAIKNDNTVWSWGGGTTGCLGDNTATYRYAPVQVKGVGGAGTLTGITAVVAAYLHSLALRNDGTVWAWGSNASGRLGDNSTTQRNAPVQVFGGGTGSTYLTGITAIAGGREHSIALKNDGSVWAWGRNDDGRLGDNTITNRYTPVQVLGGATGSVYLTGVIAIDGGDLHSLAVKSDGTVWAWGDNNEGQLGDNNSPTDQSTPVQVSGLTTGVTAVAAGYRHSLAMKNDGTVWAWGRGNEGQTGDNTINQRNTPVQVKDNPGTGNLTGITAISAGWYHSIVINANDGTLWAWGYNNQGQLGDGTTTAQSTPLNPTNLCSVAPLPIELLSFSAICLEDKAEIKWSTASEINNDYFEIQRKDGMLEGWNTVGRVEGAGNSSTIRNYQFIDTEFPSTSSSQPSTFLYYRLKQTDFNGQYEYFAPVSVKCENWQFISIYPNPSGEYIHYTVGSEAGGNLTVKMYDMLGRQILNKTEKIGAGIIEKKLSTAAFSNGAYLLKIINGNQEKIQKQFIVK